MTFKEHVHQHCVELLNSKITLLQHTLNELRESAANETKSTAGDKHETALAMLQIEQENTGRQLKNLLSQKVILERTAPVVTAKQIANGSLVKTNNGYLYICISLGKIIVEEIAVITLSPQSPLGSKLIGLRINDSAVVKDVSYVIENIQ